MEALLKILAELRPDVDFEDNQELVDSGELDSFDIVSSAAGRYYLDDPVRRSGTALVIELVGIANNADIGFNEVFIVLVEEYGKWGDIRFAGAML